MKLLQPSTFKRRFFEFLTITDELNRAKRMASDFDKETKRIKSKYIDVGFPKHVIEKTIKNFNRKERRDYNTAVVN